MKLNLRLIPLLLLAAVAVTTLAGCKSVYYGTYEKFGVHKRAG